MATEKQKKEILTKLKKNLKKLDVKNISDKYENPEGEYIWAGGPYGLIGNFTCHYEFIFYNKKEDSKKDENTLYLEVHFEDEKSDEFENVLSENDKKTLKFTTWGIRKRIIGTNDNYCVKIEEKTTTDEIVKKAIELLEELDNSIGYSLAKKCDELKPKASLSQEDGTVVEEIEYKKRFRQYDEHFYSNHGKIQKALVKKIKKDYDYCRTEIKLDDNSIRVDVLGINKNGKTNEREYIYDIYEVKPYDSPTDCIREALGQLIYYKYKFEKNGYIVRRLIVVGQNELNPCDIEYLESIQDSFPIEYKVAY